MGIAEPGDFFERIVECGSAQSIDEMRGKKPALPKVIGEVIFPADLLTEPGW
jgi:hypothetical protein